MASTPRVIRTRSERMIPVAMVRGWTQVRDRHPDRYLGKAGKVTQIRKSNRAAARSVPQLWPDPCSPDRKTQFASFSEKRGCTVRTPDSPRRHGHVPGQAMRRAWRSALRKNLLFGGSSSLRTVLSRPVRRRREGSASRRPSVPSIVRPSDGWARPFQPAAGLNLSVHWTQQVAQDRPDRLQSSGFARLLAFVTPVRRLSKDVEARVLRL